jgi:hypothetical protein
MDTHRASIICCDYVAAAMRTGSAVDPFIALPIDLARDGRCLFCIGYVHNGRRSGIHNSSEDEGEKGYKRQLHLSREEWTGSSKCEASKAFIAQIQC